MHIWLLLIVISAAIGALVALLVKSKWAIYVAGAIPWFGLLTGLWYTVYFTQNEGGGATMWLIAQFFGGTVAAVTGVFSFTVTGALRNQK